MEQPVIDTLSCLFGQQAQINFTNYVDPIASNCGDLSMWMNQYLFFLLIVSVIFLLLAKFQDDLPRLFMMALSFPHLVRQLNSINQSVDRMAKSLSLLMFIIVPLALFSFKEHYSISIFNDMKMGELLVSTVIIVVLWLYSVVIKYIFYRFVRNRFFYRKLFLAENIAMSAYMIFLMPFVLIANIDSPYHETLINVLFVLVVLCYLHYIITDLKLFIEEKVSYVQLILYFCTVKAVIIGFMIYFGVFVI